ncbi:MAG: hypothetical protein LQ346_008142 [Caloplaca aetnensis]|nr:MAG: hypothetical protein LQ346_008142 [Caloplaca aetnensis]
MCPQSPDLQLHRQGPLFTTAYTTRTAKSYTKDLSRVQSTPPPDMLPKLNYHQNIFLQALGYNFDFHQWSDLWAIAVKARRDAEPLYGFLHTLACTIDHPNELLLADANEQTQLNLFILNGLWKKIDAKVLVLENLRTRTRDQVVTIYNGRRPPGSEPVEVQVESFFSPGKSLVFLDDGAEYDRGLRRFYCLV